MMMSAHMQHVVQDVIHRFLLAVVLDVVYVVEDHRGLRQLVHPQGVLQSSSQIWGRFGLILSRLAPLLLIRGEVDLPLLVLPLHLPPLVLVTGCPVSPPSRDGPQQATNVWVVRPGLSSVVGLQVVPPHGERRNPPQAHYPRNFAREGLFETAAAHTVSAERLAYDTEMRG